MNRFLWIVLIVIAYAAGLLTHTITAGRSARTREAIFARERECKVFGDKERSENPGFQFSQGTTIQGITINEVFYSISRNTCVEVMSLPSVGNSPSELWVKDLLSGRVLWKHVFTSGDHTPEAALQGEIDQFR
jgi:hypothetical protein